MTDFIYSNCSNWCFTGNKSTVVSVR